MSPVTKKTALTIVLIVLIVMNIAALATFILWPHFRPSPYSKDCTERPHHGDMMKKELNLTEEQGQKMQLLKQHHVDTVAFWTLQLREKRRFLTDEMMKPHPDSNLIFKTSEEIGDIYGTIRTLNVYHYWEMRQICTGDQQKKLDSIFRNLFCCDEGMFDRFDKNPHHKCVKDSNRCINND